MRDENISYLLERIKLFVNKNDCIARVNINGKYDIIEALIVKKRRFIVKGEKGFYGVLFNRVIDIDMTDKVIIQYNDNEECKEMEILFYGKVNLFKKLLKSDS